MAVRFVPSLRVQQQQEEDDDTAEEQVQRLVGSLELYWQARATFVIPADKLEFIEMCA